MDTFVVTLIIGIWKGMSHKKIKVAQINRERDYLLILLVL